MARARRKSRPKAAPAPLGRMYPLCEEYLEWLGAQNYSGDTVRTARACIGYFLEWCRERSIEDVAEVTRPVLERYQRSLYHFRKKDGAPLTFRTQISRLRSLKGWFRWLARQNYLLHNPASELILPRLENRLPKYVLNVEEMEAILRQPDISTVEGLRDRAILEVFYSTGMRRMEVANLKVYDLDRERGAVTIRLGKGKRDRYIPMSERAFRWIGKYVAEARPALLMASDDGTIFLEHGLHVGRDGSGRGNTVSDGSGGRERESGDCGVSGRGGSAGAATNYTYAYSPTVITASTNSHWSRSYKDGFGRDLAVEAGYGSTVVSHTDTKYAPCACSPLGKANYISLPYGISGGTITASDGTSNIGWNSYSYDGLGRTVTQTAADASPTSYVYLGNTVKVTDPAGSWKRYTSDTLGNLVKVEEPNPAYGQADNTGTNFVTNYAYDVEGHLVSVAMPRPYGSGSYTQTRTFNYSLATGKLLSATNPENGTVSYGYYPDGVLKSKTDAKGQQVQYSYDGYGRLAYIDRYPDGVTWDPCQSVALTYDSTSTGVNGLGRLTQAATGNYWAASGDTTTCSGHSVTENYRYTAGGLTSAKSYGYQWPVNTTPLYFATAYAGSGYSYDTEGHMTGYSDSQVYNYTLDAMGRPVGLTQSNGTVWVQNVAYGPGGEMQTMQYKQGGSGTQYFTETRTYNSRAQLKELANALGTKSGIDLQYVYNTGTNNGQVAQMNDVVSGEQTVYAYDSLKRLIQAQASATDWGQSFGYDGWGNLISKTPTSGHSGTSMSLTVDATTNHVTTAGFGYDLNGNVTSLPNVTNWPSGYDVENRLGGTWYDQSNQPLNRGGVWNVYGLHGERLETDTFQLEPIIINGQLYGYYGTNTPTSQNVYFAGRMIVSNGTGVATDRLGTVRADDGGNRYEFYPYGEKVSASGAVTDLFGTYARDSSTQLDYANQRWYTSTYGRFTSPDRFKGSRWTSHPQTWNAYMYVMGDPINHRDRSGREQDCGDDDSSPCGFDCSSLPVDSFYDPSCQMEPSGDQGGAVDNSHPTQPTCNFTGFHSQPGLFRVFTRQNGSQYLIFNFPSYFDFTVVNGGPSYVWSDSQTVSRAGTLLLSDGSTQSLAENNTEQLGINGGNSSSVSVYDGPGIAVNPAFGMPGATTVTAGVGVWNFSLNVQVVAAGQTIQCPTVQWQAWVIIQTSDGKLQGNGAAYTTGGN